MFFVDVVAVDVAVDVSCYAQYYYHVAAVPVVVIVEVADVIVCLCDC